MLLKTSYLATNNGKGKRSGKEKHGKWRKIAKDHEAYCTKKSTSFLFVQINKYRK